VTAKGKRIRFVTDDTAASRWYRAEVPAAELRRRGHEASVAGRLDKHEVPSFDVVVLHRQFGEAARLALADANEQGVLTVYDIDDDYWNISPENPVYDRWRQPGIIGSLEACVREARVVTTPSPELAEFLRRLNRKVLVLPNMLPAESWPPVKRVVDEKRVVLGWGGSASHIPDLRILSGVVEQIVAQDPRVEFHCHGLREVPFAKHERIHVLPGVPLAEYPGLVATFDIGLVPLLDTQENRRKSDLKVLEYGAAGLPVVASKVALYERSVRQGESGFLVGSAKDWLKGIRRLVADPELRATAGAAGRRFAESRFIERDQNIGRWERAYGLVE
jgi:glycosyltransferase involved in cell wall biosynthesis